MARAVGTQLPSLEADLFWMGRNQGAHKHWEAQPGWHQPFCFVTGGLALIYKASTQQREEAERGTASKQALTVEFSWSGGTLKEGQ